MSNLIRTLVYKGQISLTVADTTQIVQEAGRRHALKGASLLVFGKAISAMTFMSACLKEETGEISLAVKSDGTGGDIGISGNKNLQLRGYIHNPAAGEGTDAQAEKDCLGRNGSFTVIRDDGYTRPFVGACALPKEGGVDELFEEYFLSSEQLPTRIATAVELDENGDCVFAGVMALQPLPFADAETLKNVWEFPLREALSALQGRNVESLVKAYFTPEESVWETREAKYKCNCSKEYVSGVLMTLGEEEFRRIVREDGALRVHCHYCNTDYAFTQEDADKLFGEV